MISHFGRALFLLAALSSAASAQVVPDAEALIEEGKRLRLAGDDAGAYGYYVRAYQMAPTPRAAGQLALCEFELNRWVDSEAHLQEALRAADDPWIKKNRSVLVGVMSRVKLKLGRIEVNGRPEGAEVEIAGRAVGRLPLPGPLRVPVGESFVRVAASGFRTIGRTVMVAPGELQRVTVELEPGPGDVASGGASAPAPAPERARLVGGSAAAEVRAPQGASPTWQRRMGWTSAGMAGVLLVGGGAGLLIKYLQTAQFNDYVSPQNTVCNVALPQNGGGPCSGYLRGADRARTVAIVSLAGAGLFAAVSAILLATAPTAPIELAAGPGSITWRF